MNMNVDGKQSFPTTTTTSMRRTTTTTTTRITTIVAQGHFTLDPSHLERSPRACCPSPHHGDEGHEGHEGDEGRPQGDDGRCGRPKDRRGHAPQAEGREGGACGTEHHRVRGGEEDREVRDPAARDAQVEAQARAEGGQEAHVREGGEGGGEARVEGGEGLRGVGPQEVGLSHSLMGRPAAPLEAGGGLHW